MTYLLNARYIDVQAEGADPTGTSDSTGAIQTAIGKLPSGHGGLVFPPGTYRCDNPLDLHGMRSVTLQGAGGITPGTGPATTLTYPGTGARFINAQSTSGLYVKDMTIKATNGAFTGFLLDFAQDAGIGTDTSFMGVERCSLGAGTGIALGLVKAIDGSFRDIHFSGGARAIQGRVVSGDYSTRHLFEGCTFHPVASPPILNAGQSWKFDACTFESNNAGEAAGLEQQTGIAAAGVKFDTCWMADVSLAGRAWFYWVGDGLTVDTCFVGAKSGPVMIPVDAGIGPTSFRGSQFACNGTCALMALASTTPAVHPVFRGNTVLSGTLNPWSGSGSPGSIDTDYGPWLNQAAVTSAFSFNGGVLGPTAETIKADASSGAITISLPGNLPANRGRRVTVKKVDSSGNAVTLTGTVDGVANPTLTTQWQFMTVEQNSAGTWDRVG